MLVEDDKSLREIYGIRLIAEGYEIKSAGDGEEALAMAIKERPDLILSDVMMPKISGFDMLDILRSTPETKDIKVIMMTALSSEDQRTRGESLGANRYLVKSQVGIEDVIRTVHDVLADVPVSKTPVINQPFGTSAPSATNTAKPAFMPPKPVDLPAQPKAETETVPEVKPEVEMPVSEPVEAVEPKIDVTSEPYEPKSEPEAEIKPEPLTVPTYAPEIKSEPSAEPENKITPEPITAPVYTTPDEIKPEPAPITTSAPTENTEMPQPTAPFGSPAPASLGDSMVHPTQPIVITPPTPDISTLMDQELNSTEPTLSPTPQKPIQ